MLGGRFVGGGGGGPPLLDAGAEIDGSEPRPGGGGGGMLGGREDGIDPGGGGGAAGTEGLDAGPGIPSSVFFAGLSPGARGKAGALGARDGAFFPSPSKMSRSDPLFSAAIVRVSCT
jgi:hypothetical protein